MLITSLLLAGVGFLYCITIHFFMHFSVWYPSDIVPITLNVGMGFLFFHIAFISYRWRRKTRENLRKAIVEVLPMWVKIAALSFSVLGLSMFIFNLINSFSLALEGSTVQLTLNRFYRSFSALLMVFYATEFLILYSYRFLLKRRQQ